MPIVVRQNLYSRVIVRRFDVLMLCLCKTVTIAGGNVAPRFVETVTASRVCVEPFAILWIVIVQPADELAQTSGIGAELIRPVRLAARVAIAVTDASRVPVTFVLCA